LLQEFGLAGVRRVVTKRNEHGAREVDDLGVDFEDLRSGLDLRLETVRGGTEPVWDQCGSTPRSWPLTSSGRGPAS
jgi:hypothetical protein